MNNNGNYIHIVVSYFQDRALSVQNKKLLDDAFSKIYFLSVELL